MSACSSTNGINASNDGKYNEIINFEPEKDWNELNTVEDNLNIGIITSRVFVEIDMENCVKNLLYKNFPIKKFSRYLLFKS